MGGKEKLNVEEMKFSRLTKNSHETVVNWLDTPHVKEFYYGQGLQNTLDNVDLYCQGINHNGRYAFDMWVAFLKDIPFGFLMISPITGPHDSADPYNKWYETGKQIFTLDLLIGEEAFLGKGLACHMIQQFIIDEFPHADMFLIDPEKSNVKAIHVYEKAGFSKVEEFCSDYNPKPHIMMNLSVKDLKMHFPS